MLYLKCNQALIDLLWHNVKSRWHLGASTYNQPNQTWLTDAQPFLKVASKCQNISSHIKPCTFSSYFRSLLLAGLYGNIYVCATYTLALGIPENRTGMDSAMVIIVGNALLVDILHFSCYLPSSDGWSPETTIRNKWSHLQNASRGSITKGVAV